MDHLCTKSDDFSFSRFGFIVQTDGQTDKQTEAHDRYTHHVTTVGVSKYRIVKIILYPILAWSNN